MALGEEAMAPVGRAVSAVMTVRTVTPPVTPSVTPSVTVRDARDAAHGRNGG